MAIQKYGSRYTGSANNPLYQRALRDALKVMPASTLVRVTSRPVTAAGGGGRRGGGGGGRILLALPPGDGPRWPRKKKKVASKKRRSKKKARRVTAGQFRAGSRYTGSVKNPLYKRALADALKVLGKKKSSSKKKRRGKKRASAAQIAARKRFAAAARKRSKTASRKPRAASRKSPSRRKSSSRPLSAAAQVALRAARGLPTTSQSRAIGTQRWLCGGPKRTGCGSTGRVISGKGRFARLR